MRTTPIAPIKSEEDYDAALTEVATLMDAEPDTPEGDRLDVLTTLVEAYEARHWPIEPPEPIEAIRIRMEQRGLRPKDLEPYFGSRARASEVLNRKRALTLPMIRRLSYGLGIPAAILIRESRQEAERKRSTRQSRGNLKATSTRRSKKLRTPEDV